MTLQIGDKIPASTLHEMGEDGPKSLSTEDLFSGKAIMFFALPGAFTSLCSEQHLPGYLGLVEQFKAKGIDEVVCFAVNDAFVMGAWAKTQNVTGEIRMIGDGSGLLTQKMGVELDRVQGGLGIRCQRFAMVVKDQVVVSIDIENPGEFEVSSAAVQLTKL